MFLNEKSPLEPESLADQYAAIEEFAERQLHRRREPIEGMERDPRWTPYVENRVTLVDGTEMSASYLKLTGSKNINYQTFIASQAPYACGIGKFWQMIWENGVSQVVMLTELFEKEEVCAGYWAQPEGEMLKLKNGIEVRRVQEEILLPHLRESIVKRTFLVEFQGESRTVRHYWYRNWMDHTIPERPDTLLRLINEVKQEALLESPILVHCVGGVGRTGIFVGGYHLTERLEQEDTPNLFYMVAQLRWQRPKIVSKPAAYIFLHELFL